MVIAKLYACPGPLPDSGGTAGHSDTRFNRGAHVAFTTYKPLVAAWAG